MAGVTGALPENLREGVTANQLRLLYDVSQATAARLILEFGVESIGTASGHGKKKAKLYPLQRISLIIGIYKCVMRKGRKADDVIAQMHPLVEALDGGTLLIREPEEHATSKHPDHYRDPKERQQYIRGTTDLLKLAQQAEQLVEAEKMVSALTELANIFKTALQGLPDLVDSRLGLDPIIIDSITDVVVEATKKTQKNLDAALEQHTS